MPVVKNVFNKLPSIEFYYLTLRLRKTELVTW